MTSHLERSTRASRARRPIDRFVPWASKPRAAFTLFEMVMVMALLATIVGLLWPALGRLHTEYRLRQGGQLVQVRLAAARVHAIDSGVAYQFRYEPGGQRFLVLPDDPLALAGSSGSSQSNTPSQANSTAHRPAKIAGILPSAKAHFDAASTGGSGQSVPAEWLSGIPNAEEFTGVNWSAPIMFHPDGTAAQAQIVICDKESRRVVLSVRALTGGVSISKIENGASP